MVDQAGGRAAVAELENGAGPVYSSAGEGGQRGPRRLGPWDPRNWRMRWRLLALVIIPTVTAISLGAVRVQSARDSASSFARAGQLAALGSAVTSLADAAEDERDLTAGYIATGDSKTMLAKLGRQEAVTDARAATVQRLAKPIGAAFPSVAVTDLTFAISRISALPDLRGLAHSEIAALPMTDDYSGVIAPLLAFDNELAAGSSSAELAQSVSALESLAQAEEAASQQRAILYAALLQGQFGLGGVDALVAAQSSEASALAEYQTVAEKLQQFTPGTGFDNAVTQAEQFNNQVAGPGVDDSQAIEQDALIAGNNGQQPTGGAATAQTWYDGMSDTLLDMRDVETADLASITAQASLLQQDAQGSERLTVIIVLVLLLLVLLVTVVMARSMTRPLRKLRADALDVAGRRLPEMVRRLSETEGDPAESIRIDPIGINSTDEIGEVARAFDQVHREAVRLASDEAMLRANLNAMFVNLSRRSQSLIERQLGIIDTLEQSEQEPERLSSLFRLDHLATRMRRNSENLLVLAGHEAPRKWGQPVPLVDVLRAAVSEIEQYERITLNVQPGIVVGGRTASDVVHLAAELVENATTFSPAETPVLVTGQRVSSGGVLIEISDQGLGIGEQELAYANWRLEHPPVVDVAVSRRMGLFVVGRLASRHGIRVKLRRPQSGGGLSALIWLPETVAENDGTPAPLAGASRRRLEAERYGEPGGYAAAGAVGGPAAATALRRPGARAQLPEPAPALRAQTAAAPAAPAVTQPQAPQAAVPRPTSAWWQPATVAEPPAAVVVPPAGQEPAGGYPAYGAGDFPPPGAASGAASGATSPGLPIYDSVESDWFRRRGAPISAGSGTPPAGSSWLSPADDGFRAAKSAVSPQASERTAAGLRKRVPGANLVPGSVTSRPAAAAEGRKPEPAAPARSAEEARNRLTSFQRGARAGRGAASGNYETDEN